MYFKGNVVNILNFIVLTGIISVFFLIAGCKYKTAEKMESIADIQKRQGIAVRVMNAKAAKITACELLGGTAEGYYQTTITSAIPGKITALNVSVGDNVEQNSSLLTIEPDLAANYNLAKTQYENSRKSRERVLALAEQGGVSQEVIDQVDAGFLAAKEGMDAMHKNQFVPAPFSGTVVELFQKDNQRVSPGDNLVTVARIDRIRIPLVVSDIMINKFKTGQMAIALIGNDSIYGSIEKVALSGQQSTHTFLIEAVFYNQDKLLKPGMYVPVKVVVDTKKQVVSLPMEVVISQGSEKFVFVVNDLIAKKVPVKLGIRDGDMLEIVSGVNKCDLVVVSGASLLSDGSRVKIVEE